MAPALKNKSICLFIYRGDGDGEGREQRNYSRLETGIKVFDGESSTRVGTGQIPEMTVNH